MLKTIRDNAKHLYWMLGLAGLSLFFFDPALTTSVQGIFTGPGSQNVAATVGDEEVTFRELERVYNRLERQEQQRYGQQWNSEMAERLNLRQRALGQQINFEILMAEARRLSLDVTDEELRERILSIPDFQSDGRFIGAERYRDLLARGGFTPESFEQVERENILLGKMLEVLGSTLYLSDSEVEEAYRRQVERARIRYVQMPLGRFAEEAVASQEELAAYLADNPDQFQLPEQREVSYLLVDSNMLRSQVEVPEEELRAYYDDNLDEFSTDEQVQARHILLRTGERSVEEARQELAAIRQRIEGGEDFAAVAQEVSEDPASGQRGGDLGLFGRGQMVPQFEEAAFGAEGDELVGPVESPFGVHLLQVTDRREAGQQPFEEARENIRFRLAEERLVRVAEDRAVELADRLAEEKAGVAELRAAAEEDSALFFYDPEPFGRSDAVAGIGRAPSFVEAAFSLPEGEMSGPVEVPRGWAVILAEQVLMPRAAELAEVEPQVRRAVETEARRELVEQALADAQERLSGGASLEEVATDLELAVVESEAFGADGSIPGLGFVPGLARAAMSMQEGDLGEPVETPQGGVLYQVSERTSYDPVEFEAVRDQVRQGLLGQRVDLLITSLIQKRRDELGVDYSDRAMELYNLAGNAES